MNRSERRNTDLVDDQMSVPAWKAALYALDNLLERGEISVHAEERLRRDPNTSRPFADSFLLAAFVQYSLEILDRVVLEATSILYGYAGCSHAVVGGGVNELVIENDIGFVGETSPNADIGVESAVEEESSVATEELRQPLLELEMLGSISIKESRTGRTVRRVGGGGGDEGSE